MKNKESLQTAMDRRLSFLDELPSCHPALMQRIAQEEEPVMKKRLSLGLVIALVIVLAMNLVGSLLISALIIFPALSAMRVFKSFRSVTVCSAVLSVVCALLGMLISIVGGTPVGSTIVAVDIVVFFAFAAIERFR